MSRFSWVLAAVVGLLGVATPARATSLPPGGTVAPTVLDSYTGTVRAFDLQFFTLGNNTMGVFSQAVVKNSSLGRGLDFVYQVSVGIGPGKVVGLSTTGFTGFTTDVFQTNNVSGLSGSNPFISGATIQAGSVSRDSGAGDGIFSSYFPNTITAPHSSYLLIVHTNATGFVMSQGGILSFNGGTNINAFAPVPEPGTIVLWAGCFAGLACFGMWQRRRTVASVC